MRCGACQAENPAENRFCDQCGAPLEAACPGCGATLRPGARFCGACGRRIGEAAAAPPPPASAPSAPPAPRP
ncbi:MAG TPA: zinc-ribbon domain-containing protein, partial [Methylomirabilota bacterium]